MEYSQMRTATLRTVFASAYLADIIVACMMWNNHGNHYLNVVACIITIALSGIMLAVTLQKPEKLMVYFELTGKQIIFTFMTRTVCDVVLMILLYSMYTPGHVMAIVTGIFLVAARALAQKRPDIFRELFRSHESDPELGEDDGTAYEEQGEGAAKV
eukprot:g711.t1 g711   contig10:576098-576682(+)